MITSRVRIWIISILHLLIWGSFGSGLYFYAISSQESSYLTITAARETYLSQSVFAQFIYAQTVTFDRPARITELRIPMNLPEHPMPLKIRLFQEGKPMYSWIYPLEEDTHGVIEARLAFAAPMLLDGNLDVVFDGSTIDHDHKDFAPGLFIEPKNEGYRGGSYRIASNEKGGDISLAFTETKTKYEIFREKLQNNTISEIPQILFVVALLLLLFQLPSILADFFSRNAAIKDTSK